MYTRTKTGIMHDCLTLVAATMLTIGLAGCSTSSPGAKNVMGAVKGHLAADPPAVTEAATEVLRDDMKLTLISSTSTAVDGKVVARTAQDTRVDVDVVKAGENVSNVSIRVGLGDEAMSVQILEAIKAKLK